MKSNGLSAIFLVARKPGYLVMGLPFLVSLADPGALKAELRLELMPEGTVAGMISAPGVNSLSGLNVQLLRRQIQDGTTVWQQVQILQVDARGRYRFGGLTPGDYRVVTAEWVSRPGPLLTANEKPILGYPPQAYPNGTNPAAAGTIHLKGGENIEADVTMRSVPYYPIEVPVVSNSAAGSFAVAVASDNGSGYSLGFNSRTQAVEGALPDGTYHLTLLQNGGNLQQGPQQDPLIGTQDLIVAGKRVHGTLITCSKGATIPIDIHQEYTKPDPNEPLPGTASSKAIIVGESAFPIQPSQFDISAANAGAVIPPSPVNTAPRLVEVFLVPKDESGGLISGYQRDQPGQSGTSLQNVAPGVYRVKAYARRGYIASLSASGSNLMLEPLVVVQNAAVPTIEIVLRDDFATITGTIVAASTREAVSRFPRSVWAYPLGDDGLGKAAITGQEINGTFTISNVVPGRYLVLANYGPNPNLEFRNSDAMRAYEAQGAIVNISASQTLDVKLKDILKSPDWAESDWAGPDEQ